MTKKITRYPNKLRGKRFGLTDSIVKDTFEGVDNRYVFKGLSDEPTICAHFGCPKHISLMEQLYGNKCVEHQNNKPYLHLFKR